MPERRRVVFSGSASTPASRSGCCHIAELPSAQVIGAINNPAQIPLLRLRNPLVAGSEVSPRMSAGHLYSCTTSNMAKTF
jgi:hypothetical protein